MTDTGSIDYEAVARAQALLVGSRRLDLRERIAAYQVLRRVNPSAYAAQLANDLISLGYGELRQHPEACLAVFERAVETAHTIPTAGPQRAQVLMRALDGYQRGLYTLGHRAQGFAVRQQMAQIGQQAFEAGHADSPTYGLSALAAALAEEGRHAQAADAYGRIVAARDAQATHLGSSFWSHLAWVAELDAAGSHDAALDAFTGLVNEDRARAAQEQGPVATVVWELIALSRMLESDQRGEQARTARREAGELLTALAERGEPKSWSNILSWWLVLLSLSGRQDEPVVAGEPQPPLFLDMGWSPDVREKYLRERTALEQQVTHLTALCEHDPGDHLISLITAQRRLTLRSARYWEARTHRILEPLRPYFDRGVALAHQMADHNQQQGPAILARALTDRATLLIAGKHYDTALTDFQHATALLD